jgi:hypothetical protein
MERMRRRKEGTHPTNRESGIMIEDKAQNKDEKNWLK